ncbi:response regulator [bacterium]|nr:response regulator [bacterium]
MGNKRLSALLVVDDYPTYRGMSDVIRHLGLKAQWATSWEGAQAQLGSEPFDIVMLDEELLDGRPKSCLEWLRDHQRPAQVIVMSDMPNLRTWVDYLNVGVVDLISKSASPGEIKHALDLAMYSNGSLQAVQ